MATFLLLTAIVIFACVICKQISAKIGIPVLLAFILLGMFFGSDGVVKIPFDNFIFAEKICSVALLFIIFYGGFGTNWKQAKSVAVKAIVLSSLGTVITAILVGLFCYYILNFALLESFLIGAVISSTDAASVFSILRSRHLNLRYNTASLLEIESGSNDPFSYMLTVIVLALMNGGTSTGEFISMVFSQIIFGLLFGFGIAALTLLFLRKMKISSAEYNAIFIVAIAITSYAIPTILGGNGYLSTYITGIILGNSKIDYKLELVHFFDSTTELMQMLLFFLLGLLAFPSQLPGIALTSLFIALFLTFVARPIAVFTLLTPFKSKFKQQLLVSWSGLRGAASIVFSIMVMINPVTTDHDIFHIVFFIVLFSILFQGTLIPFISNKLNMTDDESNVMKTFNDYIDEIPVQLLQFTLNPEHTWVGKTLCDIVLPPDSLVVLLIRGKERIIPDGITVLCSSDTLILSGEAINHTDNLKIFEKEIDKGDSWIGRAIADISLETDFILLIKRSGETIIPKGITTIMEDDILVVTDKSNLL